MTSKLDPLTGLAKLPDNQFWRVQNVGGLIPSCVLSLMEKRTKRSLFSKTKTKTRNVEIEHVWLDQDFTSEDLVGASNYLLKQHEIRLAQSRLYGDYPPKRLP
jgi:hypothetical protein